LRTEAALSDCSRRIGQLTGDLPNDRLRGALVDLRGLRLVRSADSRPASFAQSLVGVLSPKNWPK
jgi:hypothetical protein